MADFSFSQIALNTIDLGATVRFYSEVFGYANAGGQVGWGDVMKVQGLHPDGQTVVWWLVGKHPRIQFEIFHHTGPLLRKKPDDWSPADLGGVRSGGALHGLGSFFVSQQAHRSAGGGFPHVTRWTAGTEIPLPRHIVEQHREW